MRFLHAKFFRLPMQGTNKTQSSWFSFFDGDFSYQETFGKLGSLEHIYIRATQEEILAMKEESEDFYLFCRTMTMTLSGKTCKKILYAYSEDPPTEDGNYWHYDIDGVTPIAWE